MILPEIFYSTFTNTCPRCHKGKVFKKNNPYNLKHISDMNEQCSSCGLMYEREPGFFFGAMYVSYALMAGWLIIWFLADLFLLHLEALILASGMAISMILISPLFFHWSRLIWLNFFVRYEKKSLKGK
jgi:uncharacterized protein (DUF983 family)